MVTCLVTVIALHFYNNVTMTGKLINQNEHSYLVDFSKEAKQRNYDGDYSKVFVAKERCVQEYEPSMDICDIDLKNKVCKGKK